MRRLLLSVGLLLSSLPGLTQAIVIPHYELNVTANLAQTTLRVEGQVVLAASADARDSLDVLLHATMGTPNFQLLTPKMAPPLIREIAGGDQRTYRLRFARRLQAGERVTLKFSYQGGRLPAPQFFLDSTYCLAGGYNVAWYPQVLGRRLDHTLGLLKSTARVCVRTTARFTPVIMGCSVRQTQQRKQRISEFKLSTPAVLSLFIGHYQRTDFAGSIPLTAYRLSADTATTTYLRKSAAVVQALSEEFGSYPFPSFSLLEYPEEVAQKLNIGGSSEYGGITLPSTTFGSPYNYALFGHEIGHQWWANLVSSGGTKALGMLNEGLAQFGSLQAVKRFDPDNAERYRRTGYPGYIKQQSGLGYLTLATAGHDTSLVAMTYATAHSLGDSKGFLVLELLANTIGKTRMRAALHTITQAYRTRPLTWDDFLMEVQQAAGQDLRWFYAQWFDRPGAPDWAMQWQQQGSQLAFTVTQAQPFYQLPHVQVVLHGTKGEKAERYVDLNGAQQSLLLAVPFTVSGVELDPHFQVLHWSPEYRAQAQALTPAYQVRDLRLSGHAVEAVAQGQAALPRLPQPDRYGAAFALYYELGAASANQTGQGQDPNRLAIDYYRQAVQCAVRDPGQLVQTYYRLAQLAHRTGNLDLFRWAKENALAADTLVGNIYGISAQLAVYQ